MNETIKVGTIIVKHMKHAHLFKNIVKNKKLEFQRFLFKNLVKNKKTKNTQIFELCQKMRGGLIVWKFMFFSVHVKFCHKNKKSAVASNRRNFYESNRRSTNRKKTFSSLDTHHESLNRSDERSCACKCNYKCLSADPLINPERTNHLTLTFLLKLVIPESF